MAAAIVIMAAAPVSHAQQLLDQIITPNISGLAVEPGVTVLSRQRPEYDSIGIRLGEFTIRPELRETVGFDDNVLGQPSHRGSAVIETNARVGAFYDHSDTTAFAALSVDNNRFPEQNQQNYTNYTASIGGSHQFGRDTLIASYQHLNLNQTVRDLDVPQLNQALAFRVDSARVAYHAVFNRVFVEPAILVSKYGFDNGTAAGQPYVQTYRDRVVVQPSVTAGYELAPRRNLVVVVRDAVASYTNQGSFTPRRDYNDIAVLGGLDFDTGSVFRYRLLAGYESRSFSSSQLKTIQAPIVEAEVVWNPDALTTVTATASRRIQDSADETTVGVTSTDLGLRVDHELLRNVLLRASANAFLDDYSRGQGSQQLFTAGTGATWLLNRTMQLGLNYDFTRRVTNGAGNLGVITGQQLGRNFSENRILLQLRFAL